VAEASELETAMTLVARGSARRVTLVGLRYGERLGPPALVRARQLGIDVTLQREPGGGRSVVVARDPR
jgi:hypothetical protein